ncbi:MAG: hypothetical protein ACR2JK_06680 [Geodermatophilaceae bacterium]
MSITVVVAAYGVLVVAANARNGVLPTDFTTDWLLFGGANDFPGDFGRNVFSGSIGFGVLLLVMAAAVWFTAGRRLALPVGAAAIAFAVLLIAMYRDSGNLLAARPGVTAVLAAVGVFLAVSASAPSPEPAP